jgi:hypothetical protein
LVSDERVVAMLTDIGEEAFFDVAGVGNGEKRRGRL